MNAPPPMPAPSALKKSSGLGTASLVLGILSVLTCLLTGIPAIITGHIARHRVKKHPEFYGGQGRALAGLILGYLSIPMTVIWLAVVAGVVAPALAVALPELARNRSRSQTGTCQNNLKQISLAARIWSNEHNEIFPPDFRTMSNELAVTRVLICPGDKSKTPAADFVRLNPAQHVSYEFLKPGAKEADVATEVMFRCPIHGHLALGDGSVQENVGRK